MLTKDMFKKVNNHLNNLSAKAYDEGIYNTSRELANEISERIYAGIRNTPGIDEKQCTELFVNINKEFGKSKTTKITRVELTSLVDRLINIKDKHKDVLSLEELNTINTVCNIIDNNLSKLEEGV